MSITSDPEELYRALDMSAELLQLAHECYDAGQSVRAVALASVAVTLFPIELDGADSVFVDLVGVRAEMGPVAFDRATRPFDYINSLRYLTQTEYEPTPEEVLQPLMDKIVLACVDLCFGRGVLKYCLTRLIERETAAGLFDFVAFYRCLLAYVEYEPCEALAATLPTCFQALWRDFQQALHDRAC